MTEKAKMIAGNPYDASNPELTNDRLKARKMTSGLNRIIDIGKKQKERMIEKLFGFCGKNPRIETGFHCDYGFNITVGDNFYANYNLIILDPAPVHIGDNCLIGPNVQLFTATHPTDRATRLSGLEMAYPITIGNDCWIGGNVVINPGVTIGNNVIIGSGSVVTDSFGDNVVIAGNPARIIRHLFVEPRD